MLPHAYIPHERPILQVRMHADMGLNMIRLWGGCGATRSAFLAACDELGLLVWWEFWITGDCDGRGATPVRSLALLPAMHRVMTKPLYAWHLS